MLPGRAFLVWALFPGIRPRWSRIIGGFWEIRRQSEPSARRRARGAVSLLMHRSGSTSPSAATLADHAAVGFGVVPTCRGCWHVGAQRDPATFAAEHGLPLETEHPAVERRLRCSRCGERRGYLQLINPSVVGVRP